MVEPVALTHLGVADLNRVDNDVVEPLQGDLVALVLFELGRLQTVGLQQLQVAFFVEAAGDLEFRHLGQLMGDVVVGCHQAKTLRFLQDELFLHQGFDDVAFEIEPLDHLFGELALEHLAVTLDRALILGGKLTLADRFAVDHRHFRGGAVAHLVAAIKRHENNDDEPEQEENRPVSFSFTEKIKHRWSILSSKQP